ncbi:hypothetical protein [Microbacterium suwonense]|uniref:DUF5667 domain-containing protein n=1 Tax=Microbacterium suwonense TaxID=683047 RepID=A0ABM8FU87_9MICO|nr:hypothetical protein [Microbacterium suwonense]BDZ39232.1 hypothetical protein GCM10025863_18460 [Microbacterium suwonense]
MTTLDDLFPDGKHRPGAHAVADDHHTVRRLDELFGDRRTDLERTHRASARPALIAMVNSAAADATSLPEAPQTPHSTPRHRRRRIDVVNVAAAGLAVVAVVAAGVMGGVQIATASPASDALHVLSADEKTIESATAGLEAAHSRLIDAIADADAAAEALRPALQQVREATDPADIPEGWADAPEDAGTIPIADGKALDTVLAAIDTYQKELAAFTVPELPAVYTPSNVDSESLTEVAAAIDAAQLQLNAIDRSSAEVRTVRTAVDARAATFAGQVSAFAATFPGVAKGVIEQHPDAEQELKDAVTAAAAAVSGADLLTADGAATLPAYRDAVVAVVADQVAADRQREREEQEARERAEREERERQQWRPPSSQEPDPGETTAPPADPDDSGDSGDSDDQPAPPEG